MVNGNIEVELYYKRDSKSYDPKDDYILINENDIIDVHIGSMYAFKVRARLIQSDDRYSYFFSQLLSGKAEIDEENAIDNFVYYEADESNILSNNGDWIEVYIYGNIIPDMLLINQSAQTNFTITFGTYDNNANDYGSNINFTLPVTINCLPVLKQRITIQEHAQSLGIDYNFTNKTRNISGNTFEILELHANVDQNAINSITEMKFNLSTSQVTYNDYNCNFPFELNSEQLPRLLGMIVIDSLTKEQKLLFGFHEENFTIKYIDDNGNIQSTYLSYYVQLHLNNDGLDRNHGLYYQFEFLNQATDLVEWGRGQSFDLTNIVGPTTISGNVTMTLKAKDTNGDFVTILKIRTTEEVFIKKVDEINNNDYACLTLRENNGEEVVIYSTADNFDNAKVADIIDADTHLNYVYMSHSFYAKTWAGCIFKNYGDTPFGTIDTRTFNSTGQNPLFYSKQGPKTCDVDLVDPPFCDVTDGKRTKSEEFIIKELFFNNTNFFRFCSREEATFYHKTYREGYVPYALFMPVAVVLDVEIYDGDTLISRNPSQDNPADLTTGHTYTFKLFADTRELAFDGYLINLAINGTSYSWNDEEVLLPLLPTGDGKLVPKGQEKVLCYQEDVIIDGSPNIKTFEGKVVFGLSCEN